MQITKFYCDNCKNEVKSQEELTPLMLSMKIGDRYPRHSIAICNECIESLGFEDCKNDEEYISNYSVFIGNTFQIIKKLFKNKKLT